jgi:hypothetical protein
MTGMKSRTKGFRGAISSIDNIRDMMHDNVTLEAPLLNCKMLDTDVAGTRSRAAIELLKCLQSFLY